MQTPKNTVINEQTFVNMKVHFKSSDKTVIISYANFLNMADSPIMDAPNGNYVVKDENGVPRGLINTSDILFIAPAEINE